MLVDTHAHLTMAELARDLPGVLERASAAGLEAVVCVGIDLESSKDAVRLARQHPRVAATVGIHPNDSSQASDDWLARLRQIASAPEVVAIGEIGLDYYRDRTPRDRQKQLFQQQLDLAAELGLPVVVHNRQASADVAEMLRRWSRELTASHPRGVLHCFSGDKALMDDVVASGFYVSFAGPVTYLNAKDAAEMAAAASWDRLLLETDSPYLAPHPHRGRMNEPAMVRLVAERVAQLRRESLDKTIEITGDNATRLFRLARIPTP